MASKVGRWSPRPVLQQPKKQSPVEEGNEYPRFLLEDGARRPPSYLKYALFVLSAFARPTEVCLVLLNESGKAHHSRTVVSVPRPPTTKETVPSRRGNKYPRFLLEDGARRPPSYYSLRQEKTAAASQQLRFKKHIIYFYFIKIVVTFLISPPTHYSGWTLTPSHQN